MVAGVVESEAAACVEGREVLRGSDMMRVVAVGMIRSCQAVEERTEVSSGKSEE